jgi:hypothetical protein
MNPFIAFCLYVAARVFVQYLKTHKDDATVISSLQFLLAAMQALKAKNPLTESFLVQLDVDLEGSDIRVPSTKGGLASMPLRACTDKTMYIPVSTNDRNCTPLLDIRTVEEQEQPTDSQGRPVVSKPPASHLIDFLVMPCQHGQGQGQGQGQTCMGDSAHRSKESPRPVASTTRFSGMTCTQGEPAGLMDVDISFENTSSQMFPSQSNSGHPTPSMSSNNASSSQTSFSPPRPEDLPGLTKTPSLVGLSPSTASKPGMVHNSQEYPFFDPSFTTMSQVPGSGGATNAFEMLSAWNRDNGELSRESSAGGSNLTGMTPGNIQSWQPMGILKDDWMFPGWNGPASSG